jgi:MFS family permease
MMARQWLRLVLVGLGTSVVPLDSAVNIAFPDITGSFGLPLEMIQWVVICYVLTHAGLMLAFGRIGDIFGHGRVFRAGLLWNGAAFCCCAVAPSYEWLLFCRFLQGIGAALILSCAPALVTGLFREDQRARALAAFTMMFALGSAAGPLLGGMLVDRWGWPGVFWFRAPIAWTALAILTAAGLPVPPRSGPREPIDLPGASLLAFGIGTVLLGLNQLQSFARHAFPAFAFGVVGLAGLVSFVRRERRVTYPIVNLDLFGISGFAAVNGASVLVNLTGFSVLLFAPYYLVHFTGLSLPLAGAVLAASFLGSIAASPLAARMIERFPARHILALGAILNGAGLYLIGTWDAAASQTVILIPLVLQGFGAGLFQVAYMDLVMGTLPSGQRGVAGGLAMLTRTLGIVIGATLLTLVFHVLGTSPAASGEDFLPAFRATFRLAGMVSAIAGVAAGSLISRRRH